MSSRDDGPVYYREIQKNAYLKRIPSEDTGSKLRPLGQKKPALKPMWTLLCVHNGRIPYLEQYPAAESPSTASHTPAWRASLRTARHVTASVRPRVGTEYDFLIDTDHGPLRMLAPDWESMQDWVTTLRAKLHELKILPGAENVYCRAPAAPAPRAPQRDPTSPLPPTPPVPPTRIPGIEITPRPTAQDAQSQPQQTDTETEFNTTETNQEPRDQDQIQRTDNQTRNHRIEESVQHSTENQILNNNNINITQESQAAVAQEPIDISNWEPFDQPGTSQEKIEPTKGVTKICGQNICLDDSILKRNVESTESDEEFFAEIDRIHDSVENLTFDDAKMDFKQTLLVNNREKDGSSSTDNNACSQQSTNITVIQVSNKPPHTAIPVMGPETNIFDFDFKQNVSVQNDSQADSTNFINIVNTEIQVHNTTDNNYGTVFEEPYVHISLTTTVNLTGERSDANGSERDGIYERLCLASTSNDATSPLPIRKIRCLDKNRKSSLPNLDVSSESPYEYLFPNYSQNSSNGNSKNTTNVTLNHNSETEINSDSISRDNKRNFAVNSSSNEVTVSESSRSITTTDISRNNVLTTENESSNRNSDNLQNNGTSNNSRTNINQRPNDSTTNNARPNKTNITTTEISRSSNDTHCHNSRSNQNVHINLTNSIPVGNTELTARVIRANIERSHSQNAYDSSPRMRDQLIRRVQRKSPKGERKNDKTETHTKPIWKRGLTELSLLSRLRGIGQGKRQESPNRQENDNDRVVHSSVKVIHRSRPEGRVDYTRRRSSSLSNGQSPPAPAQPPPPPAPLQSLRARQAAALRADQRRAAATAARVPKQAQPGFVDYDGSVWIWWWGAGGAASRCGGRAGDRVVALRGVQPKDANHARQLIKTAPGPVVDILFHRVPLAKICVFPKRDLESIGIRLDNECGITHVESQSAAARAGVPPPGSWAVTEVNNRPINLLKGGEEEMNRISLHGTEVSILLQPTPLVKKLRAAIKANKPLLSIK